MKKKLLLIALAVVILSFAFVLSVGAAETKNDKGIIYSDSNEFGTVNILDVMTPVTSSVKTDAENYTTTYYEQHSLEQRVVLANGDGTYSTYPSAYIMNLNNNYYKLMAVNPAKLNAHTGYEYTMESIIRFEMPEGITRIGHDERSAINIKQAVNCVYLSLPASYDTSSGTQMGSAFQGMSSLVTIDMSKCTKMVYVNGNWFRDCTSLTTILWPQSGLKEIRNGAFVNCTSLKTLVLPEGTTLPEHTQNDYGAFGNCTSLESVTIPSSMTNIHKRAFHKCTSLTTINFPEGVDITFQDHTFAETGVNSISIPESITVLGNYMFQNCKSLATVKFNGTNLTKIGTAAFENCIGLGNIVLPEGLTILGNCAFKGCKGLTSVTFPTTLTTVEDREHFLNTALTEVIGLENTKLTRISYSMFRGLKSWTPDVIKLPNTVTYIDTYGFADVGVKKVIIGDGMVEIKNEAFTGCKSMNEFVLPSGLTTINFNNSTARLFFVTSTDTTYLETIKSKAGASAIVSYESYMSNPFEYETGKYVISGMNTCEAFYDNQHRLDPEKSNACAGICANCGLAAISANPIHNYITTIVYESYLSYGVRTQTCQNEGCTHKAKPFVTDANPIILGFKGFSVKENGNGITFGYSFDKKAIEEFEAIYGKVELGFVVAVKSSLGENAPLKANGDKSSDNVVKTAITDRAVGYTGADLILRGNWNGNVTVNGAETDIKKVEFYMAGYLTVGDTTVYLNQNGSSASCGTITYEQVNS